MRGSRFQISCKKRQKPQTHGEIFTAWAWMDARLSIWTEETSGPALLDIAIGDLLDQQAHRFGDREALVCVDDQGATLLHRKIDKGLKAAPHVAGFVAVARHRRHDRIDDHQGSATNPLDGRLQCGHAQSIALF